MPWKLNPFEGTPPLGYSYGPSASTSHPYLPHKPWKLPPFWLQSLPLPPKPWNLSPIFTNSIVRYNFGPSSRASICVGVVWTGPVPPPYTLAKMKILVRLQPVARANPGTHTRWGTSGSVRAGLPPVTSNPRPDPAFSFGFVRGSEAGNPNCNRTDF